MHDIDSLSRPGLEQGPNIHMKKEVRRGKVKALCWEL